MMDEYFTIKWIDGVVRMLDQRLLPQQEIYRDYTNYKDVALAIKDMVIRGAPAIGVAAGYGMALAALNSTAHCVEDLVSDLNQASAIFSSTRPTAVNLKWALKHIADEVALHRDDGLSLVKDAIIATALNIAEEDVKTNKEIGKHGSTLIPDGANLIHHCNTGALATVDYGTALGVIRFAHESGKKVHVYVDETRPRFQGARLTSWELVKLNIPHTVIVDGASGHIMRTRKVDACLVGCDRIAANGDVANKIGTYNLALVAHAHNVPFYSVGPTSTFDMKTRSGDEIPIEERNPDEITHVGSYQITPDGVSVENPAFDITPSRFISGIITEMGIARAPYNLSLARLISGG